MLIELGKSSSTALLAAEEQSAVHPHLCGELEFESSSERLPLLLFAMEPQQFSCGNCCLDLWHQFLCKRLQWSHNNSVVETSLENGFPSSMKPMLQWSHNNSVVETYVPLVSEINDSSGFNGATTIQLWKHARDYRAGWCGQRFNGATTIQLWKLIHGTGIIKGIWASMEPQQFSCGNFVHKWNIPFVDFELQWSHNNSVVETTCGWDDPMNSIVASMEPQQFSCGNVLIYSVF